MLQGVGKDFVCGKFGVPNSKTDFISLSNTLHVMMVYPHTGGKGVAPEPLVIHGFNCGTQR